MRGPPLPEINPENFEAFFRLVYDAVTSKNYALIASLAVVAVVYLVRRYGGTKFPVLKTNRGGAVLALVTSVAGAAATAFLGGVPFGAAVLLKALGVGFMAAGGFSVVKKIVFGDPEQVKAEAKAEGQAAADASKPKTAAEFVNGGGI